MRTRVLVVVEQPQLRNLTVQALANNGFDVCTAYSPVDALSKDCGRCRLRVALVEQSTPDAEAALVRSLIEKSMRVVAVAGDINALTAAGAHRILVKPFNVQALVTAILAVLELGLGG